MCLASALELPPLTGPAPEGLPAGTPRFLPAAARSVAAPTVRKMLVVPMWFDGTDTTFSVDSLASSLQGGGGFVSLNDYFLQVSKGRIGISLRFLPWRKSAHDRDSCGKASPTASACLQSLAIEAAGMAQASGVDLSEYDNDGDGAIDGLAVIYAGRSYQSSWDGSAFDGKDPSQEVVYFDSKVTFGKVTLDRSVMASETFGKFYATPVGGFAHECSHLILKLSDLYDANGTVQGEDGGLGSWDLMSGGDGGIEVAPMKQGPWKPTGLSAYSLMELGWTTPREVDSAQEIRLAPGEVARIWTDPFRFRQYLLLENRDRSGIDSILPGPGLLVTKVRPEHLVRYNLGTSRLINIDSSDMGVSILEASGKQRIASDASGAPHLEDLFGQASDSLTDNGPVSLALPGGKPSGAWLRDVRTDGADVVLRARSSPRKGYGIGKWDQNIWMMAMSLPELTVVDSIRIPESGRVVAFQSLNLERNAWTCTRLWTSRGAVDMGTPVASVCDTLADGTAFRISTDTLKTPVPVKAGDLLYLGQTSGTRGTLVYLPELLHADVADSSWVYSSGYAPGRRYASPAARALVELDATGLVVPTSSARSGPRVRHLGDAMVVQGAQAGEDLVFRLCDLQGRTVWTRSVRADSDGKARIARPSLATGTLLLDVQGAKTSIRDLFLQL